MSEIILMLQYSYNNLDIYLEGTFTTIVYKDVITRSNINDKMLLGSVLKNIIGSPISTRKISDTRTIKECLQVNILLIGIYQHL